MTSTTSVQNEIPAWVPRPILSMVEANTSLSGDIGRRLLFDTRMEAVWKVLLKANVDREFLESIDDYRRLKTFDLSEEGLSIQERACVSFFAFSVFEMSARLPVLTAANIDFDAKRWAAAADVCDQIWAYNYQPLADRKLVEALAISSAHLRKCAEDLVRKNADSPYFLSRSSGERGDDELRVRTRSLAAETHRLFGQFLYGTVAKVVTVALALPKPISEKSVQNWCSDLKSKELPAY